MPLSTSRRNHSSYFARESRLSCVSMLSRLAPERAVSTLLISNRLLALLLKYLPRPLNRIRLFRRLIRPQPHNPRKAQRVSAFMPLRLHHVVERHFQHDFWLDHAQESSIFHRVPQKPLVRAARALINAARWGKETTLPELASTLVRRELDSLRQSSLSQLAPHPDAGVLLNSLHNREWPGTEPRHLIDASARLAAAAQRAEVDEISQVCRELVVSLSFYATVLTVFGPSHDLLVSRLRMHQARLHRRRSRGTARDAAGCRAGTLADRAILPPERDSARWCTSRCRR